MKILKALVIICLLIVALFAGYILGSMSGVNMLYYCGEQVSDRLYNQTGNYTVYHSLRDNQTMITYDNCSVSGYSNSTLDNTSPLYEGNIANLQDPATEPKPITILIGPYHIPGTSYSWYWAGVYYNLGTIFGV